MKLIIFHKYIIIFCYILTIFGISGCMTHIENTEISIGITNDCLGFHPYIKSFDTITMAINANIFNSLIDFDENLKINPSLAISWYNINNLTWRFKLRENVKFHDGNNFSAEDVKYSIDIIKKDETYILRDLLSSISDVRIIDNYTIDIVTKIPNPTLLNNLVDIFIISKQDSNKLNNNIPIGTGGYKFVEHVENDYILLERFDNYWNDELIFKKVVFKVIPDDKERKDALISGIIDVDPFLSPGYYEEVRNVSGIDVKLQYTPSVSYLSFDFREKNTKGEKNVFSDLRVRKAIYHAINISNIIENKLNGLGIPASQFVNSLVFGYNEEIERLEYNTTKAVDLLYEAGYEDGLSIELDCMNFTIQKSVCKEIANQLSNINITVNLNALDYDEFLSKLFSGNSSFHYLGWATSSADGSEIFDLLLRTKDNDMEIGSYNTGYYSNSKIDNIGKELSKEMDNNKRLSLMKEGFSIAMEDIACIPLYSSANIDAYHNNIIWITRSDSGLKVEDIKIL